MSSALDIYKKHTKKSSKLFERSKKLHINGVSHNIRFFEPYPFVTKSARGKYLIDVDDNKYTDYWMGHWSLILGHAAPKIADKVKKQVNNCWMHGTVNENTIDFSEVIQKAVPVAEKIRYVSTGTEATMYATRIARAKTGKKIIAKIDGGWHGYTSDLLKSVNYPFDQSESAGLTDERNIVSIPYNDLEKSIAILESVKNDLAGVIIEPVLGGAGCIPATKEYLIGIQEFIHRVNALYILDEIVTGFRFRFGCLYNTMELDPDIVTLGKIVGGGFPIGVICGKDEVIKITDTNANKRLDRSYIGGGTFSANPMTMTSGRTMLKFLKKNSGPVYKKIGRLGEEVRKGLAKTFQDKAVITGMGSLFMPHFLANGVTRVTNAEEASKCDIETLKRYHFELIARDGIFFLPGKLGAMSYVHSESDVKNLLEASKKFAVS
ncbi:MAG: aminotransferase class III-fold pyridoxal phosphate-dependent enzyme [Thaumarchaeota archaeon]|nr:aminotransferase class III-fold pyridoxal phosphate-dependent enzyme [Nitrososphaerota archaeon]MDE1817486.1 aminotransferase class III-fold pyridoxal phosphate-dependent enzyme [Nitrososphaerota archaeon]MDE1876440.1 aminotransferase class III-fold pyridoxal phosphate-dependent enzyme [Nitrososphaerota archaeon]